MSTACVVCGEALDGVNVATCHACGGEFHLVTRQDVPGKDCGEVWINEEFLALEFACRRCLQGDEAAPQPEANRGEKRRYARRAGTRAADIVRRRHRRP